MSAARAVLSHPVHEAPKDAGRTIERRHSNGPELVHKSLGRILGGAGAHPFRSVVQDEGSGPKRQKSDQGTSGTLGLDAPLLSVRGLNLSEASPRTLGPGKGELGHTLGIERRGPRARTPVGVQGTLPREPPGWRAGLNAARHSGAGGRIWAPLGPVDGTITSRARREVGTIWVVEGDTLRGGIARMGR